MVFRRKVLSRAVAALIPLAAFALQTAPLSAEPKAGAVYLMTNEAAGNAIMVFEREFSGKLVHIEDVWTGGKGSGGSKDPLGSQGALSMSACGHYLIGVNAGSDNISVLGIGRDGLHVEDLKHSGGTFPTSVTVSGDLVYVLNAGGTPNITGFRLLEDGKLEALPGGSRALPGGAASGPAQVSFDPDGDALIVTEKNTNKIDIFALKPDGAIKDVVSVPSAGETPFGFNFARRGALLVSEAGGGVVDGSSISSYQVDDDSTPASLSAVSKALPIGQTAACWVAVTPDGRYAFTANSASQTIGSFRVSNNGALTLLDKAAATVIPGSIPTDMAVTRHGQYLYAIGAATNSLFVFRIEDGNLTWIETESGIPASAQGLVAR